tara:strand:- start:571 stop:915 length:345 start_codon:yes stop_codon:yes gene_type:complete
MNNIIGNLANAIRAFRTANSMLKGEGQDSHILVEHIEAFLYISEKKQSLLNDAQKNLGYRQPKAHRVFKHLKRLGWVSISTAEHDERHRIVAITKEGNDFLAYLKYKLSKAEVI